MYSNVPRIARPYPKYLTARTIDSIAIDVCPLRCCRREWRNCGCGYWSNLSPNSCFCCCQCPFIFPCPTPLRLRIAIITIFSVDLIASLSVDQVVWLCFFAQSLRGQGREGTDYRIQYHSGLGKDFICMTIFTRERAFFLLCFFVFEMCLLFCFGHRWRICRLSSSS